MAVTFVGDCEWRQSTPIKFGGGGYELDTATVSWRGRVDKKQAFLSSLKRFQPLAGHPRMFLDLPTDNGELVLPTVALNYFGVKGDGSGAPPAKPDTGLVRKNISAPSSTVGGGIGSGGGYNTTLGFQFEYYAARTTWTWYEFARPNPIKPRYNTSEGTDPAATIFNIRMSDGSYVSAAVMREQLKAVKRVTTVSDYRFEEIAPNAIWHCSASADLDFDL